MNGGVEKFSFSLSVIALVIVGSQRQKNQKYFTNCIKKVGYLGIFGTTILQRESFAVVQFDEI